MHTQPSFRSSRALRGAAQDLCRRVFGRSPISLLVLTPELKIVDANEIYLRQVSRSRDSLAGLDMFAAFPDSPHLAAPDGVRNLRLSFEAVLRTGCADVMPLQRYDIKPAERPWEMRYWYPMNWPVLDDKGSILALVHHVTDVSALIMKMPKTRFSNGSPALLRRADEAICTARELVQRTRDDLAVRRARLIQVRANSHLN